jgi:hypothetical protein
MLAFYDCIYDQPNNCQALGVTQHGNSIEPKTLKKAGADTPLSRSLDLAACVRDALKQDRDIKFGEVSPAASTCPYN